MASGYVDIINKMKKEWKCEDLMNGAGKAVGDKIPFSSPLMNWATYGGIPRNRITEFFGDPGGGKTTTAVDICKNGIEIFKKDHEVKLTDLRDQLSKGRKTASAEIDDLEERGPKKVLYIDLEHSFDGRWAQKLGIDEADWVMQPPDVVAESILQTIIDLIETGELGLVVLDSIPSLVPRTELEKKMGEKTVAALANILTIFCRKLVPLLTRYETTMLFINQTRDNQNNPYVVQTPGGRAPKFYACLRVYFRVGSPVDFLGNELPKSVENPAGYKIMAKLEKQKSAPWDRKLASYYLMCNSGIRPDFDYAQLAVNKYGIIKKTGAWFTLCNPYTGEVIEKPDPYNGKKTVPVKLNGLGKVYEYLAENTEYYEQLKSYILDDINNKSDIEEYEVS